MAMIKKRTIIYIALTLALAAFFSAVYIKRRIQREADSFFESYEKTLYAIYDTDFHEDIDLLKDKSAKVITTGRDVRDIVKYGESYFAATSGGLLKLDKDGRKEGLYTTNNGLASSDLTCVAVYRDTLFAASSDGRIISVTTDGIVNNYFIKSFFRREIISLTVYADQLLIVFRDDIWRYDGDKFALMPLEADMKPVTHAFVHDGGLYITGENAIHDLSGGKPVKQAIDAAGDLTSYIRFDGGAYVSTLDGIYEIMDGGIARKALDDIYINSMLYYEGELAAASYMGRIYFLSENGKREYLLPHLINGLREVDGRLFILTNGGIYRFYDESVKEFYAPGNTEMSSNNLTSLCVTGKGRVYAGTFENGVDMLNSDGDLVMNITDEDLKEINSLAADGDRVYVGHTAGAAVIIDDRVIKKITTEDGLIGENVACVKRVGSGTYFATGRGLSLMKDGYLRSIYAFHGLVSNKVYCLEEWNGALVAGTLAGISIVDGLEVRRNITHSDSGLSNNWVTALLADGERLFIGTYGGGLNVMEKDYKITATGGGKKNICINFNSLEKISGKREKILAGSADDGIIYVDFNEVLQEGTGFFTGVFPSRNVTSIAVFGDYVFVATDKGLVKVNKDFIDEQDF